MRFRKIYAVIPEDLYRELISRDIFKKDFDGVICNLLERYCKGCDRDEYRNGNDY